MSAGPRAGAAHPGVVLQSVIGHGVEAEGHFFRCAHCAREQGYDALRDRTGPAVA